MGGVLLTENTKILRDALGNPIPQIWDEASNEWIAQTEICCGSDDIVTATNSQFLTQSQYDNLTEEEKNNGTFYFIKEV